MSQIIPVKPFPFKATFKTHEEAIHGAQNHAMQPKARAHGATLEGSDFIDACWNDANFYLHFSNEMTLHVFVEHDYVDWCVRPRLETEIPKNARLVGSEPSLLDWGKLGILPMDCSALIAKRRGATFWQLFVNEAGFWVYLRRQLILTFAPIYRTDTGSSLLYVYECD